MYSDPALRKLVKKFDSFQGRQITVGWPDGEATCLHRVICWVRIPRRLPIKSRVTITLGKQVNMVNTEILIKKPSDFALLTYLLTLTY